LILATGGPGMVRAAYASGTPAIGVGSGNAPTFISASADVERAAQAIVLSKSFDNGLICGSEHNLIVDASRRTEFVAALERAGAAVLTPAETGRFGMVFNDERTGFRPEVVGQAATLIAHTLGIAREWPIKLLVVPTELAEAGPLAGEKMAPVVSLFTTDGDDEALDLSLRLLANQGAGHTAIIHAEDESLVERFSRVIPASRILVNSPGSHGVCGITSGLSPSFTLGCGTFGGTSTTDNVSYRHLQNIKRLARVIS
jgi:acyl-CoA reductase-like NAD-dependent aldehyde dehydrogenase